MDEINIYYVECEDCYGKVSMMEMIVKETADGNCTYCPKCVAHHKYLEEETKKLWLKWGIDPIAFAKQVDKEEKRLLKEQKK